MNVLLLSMPDSFEHMPTVAIRLPNGALTSLAGNVDAHHHVAVADLILRQSSVRETVTQLVARHNPDVIGLSVMTFQRRTAGRIADLVRTLKPAAKVAVGGYDPSLAYEDYADMSVDYIVRGEGEATFRDLLRALEARLELHSIAGLSFRENGHWIHNPARAVHRLQADEVRLPNRDARVLNGYTAMGRNVGRYRNLARMHVRLQLLLDYRHARPQLPHVFIRPGSGRHTRRTRPRCGNHFSGRRQHHARCSALRGAVPSHHRCRPQQPGLFHPRYDVGHRKSRRHARAAYAEGRLSIRVSRHREHPRRRPCLPQCLVEKHAARTWKKGWECHAQSHRLPAPQ